MQIEQVNFGSGEAWAIGSDSLATPQPFAELQDISVTFKINSKTLKGKNMFPVATAQSDAEITGKANMGRFDLALYAQQVFGAVLATGRTLIVSGEAANISSSTPWTVTVANAADYLEDLGVTDGNDLKNHYEKVASAPTTGQYSVNASSGVYTFATADAGKPVQISYTYSDTAGHSMTLSNQIAGTTLPFKLVLRNSYQGTESGIVLYNCISGQLALATKMGDFQIPEFDFSASADAAGRVFSAYGE